jgi:hypothetical protein
MTKSTKPDQNIYEVLKADFARPENRYLNFLRSVSSRRDGSQRRRRRTSPSARPFQARANLAMMLSRIAFLKGDDAAHRSATQKRRRTVQVKDRHPLIPSREMKWKLRTAGRPRLIHTLGITT